jgi:hypothetical protein
MAAVLALVSALAAGAEPSADRDPAAADLLEEARQNRRRLLSSHTAAPPPSEPSANLDEAIRQLREAVRQPIMTAAPSDDTASAAEVPTVPPPAPAPQRPPLSPEQLQRIRERPLADLGDPMALADSLFLGGHLTAAGALYERMLAEAALAASDQAWCLFQAAGCKRATDPGGALTLYERLLAQHPESQWTEAAKARQAVLQWWKKAQPQALLTSVTSTTDPNTTPEGTGP